MYSSLRNTHRGQERFPAPILVGCQHLINLGAARQTLSATKKKKANDKTSVSALNAAVRYHRTLGELELEATGLDCWQPLNACQIFPLQGPCQILFIPYSIKCFQ